MILVLNYSTAANYQKHIYNKVIYITEPCQQIKSTWGVEITTTSLNSELEEKKKSLLQKGSPPLLGKSINSSKTMTIYLCKVPHTRFVLQYYNFTSFLYLICLFLIESSLEVLYRVCVKIKARCMICRVAIMVPRIFNRNLSSLSVFFF